MTEIATQAPTELEVLPPQRPMASEAIGQLMLHADAMSAAKKLGDALAETDMVPKDYKGKPGNAAAAILYGAELGLNPIQSLQQIFVIHGSPAIYARTAAALVKRHGIVVETVLSDNESVTVSARDPRTGQVEEATWDIARATLAGYTANKKYETNPQEMLYAKAAMEVCRKIAPDILLGIPYSREELELEQPPQTSIRRGGRGVGGLRDRAQQAIDGQVVEGDSGDQDPPAASAKREMTAKRRAAESRMFGLIGKVKPKLSDDDRYTVYRSVTGRPEVNSTDDLADDEVKAVADQLYEWGANLADEIREIVNAADLAAMNKENEQ